MSKNSKRKLDEITLISPHAFARVQGAFFSVGADFDITADLELRIARIYKKGYGSIHVPFSNVKCFKVAMGTPSGDVLDAKE